MTEPVLYMDKHLAAAEKLRRWALKHLTIEQIEAAMVVGPETWHPLQTMNVNKLTSPEKLDELKNYWANLAPARFKLMLKAPGETVEQEIDGVRFTAQDMGKLLIFAVAPAEIEGNLHLWKKMARELKREVVLIPKGSEVWAVEVPEHVQSGRVIN